MISGEMWFDNDPKASLELKVERAVKHYWDEMKNKQLVCYVHPSMISDASVMAGNIKVIACRSILPNNFFIVPK